MCFVIFFGVDFVESFSVARIFLFVIFRNAGSAFFSFFMFHPFETFQVSVPLEQSYSIRNFLYWKSIFSARQISVLFEQAKFIFP